MKAAGFIARPFDGQGSQQAIVDHGEEIIHQRGVPFPQELAFEIAIVIDQLLSAHAGQWQRRRGERLIETLLEGVDLTLQAELPTNQSESGAHQ
ncbi:MAG: hypothetical protein CFE26_17835, partial [Verrucomicrobiales bacterium VVV1]